jgi:flagellar motor switch protein FliG
MTLSGKQKAALLLMSMDASTASDLLKGLDPALVEELAVEVAYLDASGHRNSNASLELAKDFCNSLTAPQTFHCTSFIDTMLKTTVGQEQAKHIKGQIGNMLKTRDPFLPVRTADAQTLAAVLETDHPQAVGVVLSELDPKKSSEVLGLLKEGVRLSAINRMTSKDTVNPEARAKIGQMLSRRLEGMKGRTGGTPAKAEQALRQVAIILRNLGKELRDAMIQAIREKDPEAADKVSELMIVWEDILYVADRSLQTALRGIEAQQLALALHRVDDSLRERIKKNISERATAMMEEEASLMSSPKKTDVEAARGEIVKSLQQMNEKGELQFIE